MFFQFFPKHTLPGLLCLLTFGLTAIKPLPAQVTGPHWIRTSSLNYGMYVVAATGLSDGRVLTSGGVRDYFYPADYAELYDPESDKWTVTGSLMEHRFGHTATLLPNGQVLVAGGIIDLDTEEATRSAELYDPKTGSWSFTARMKWPRYDHTALLLPNGSVLVAGGGGGGGELGFEIYDPTTKTWSSAGHPETYSYGASLTQLSNGKVLVAGPDGTASSNGKAYIYDPVSGTLRDTGSLQSKKIWVRAVSLADGRVLVTSSNSTELYDPNTDSWSPTAGPGGMYALTTLPNGQVLAANYNNVKLYDTVYQKWTDTAKPTFGVNILNLMPDGKVLGVLSQASLFDLGEDGQGKLLTVSAASYRRTDLARGSIAAAFGHPRFGNS